MTIKDYKDNSDSDIEIIVREIDELYEPTVDKMTNKIKELLEQEAGGLEINFFCTLRYLHKDSIGIDNLVVYFICHYGKAWARHSAHIESREASEIKEAIKKEQTVFFDGLRDMLNRQIDGGYIG